MKFSLEECNAKLDKLIAETKKDDQYWSADLDKVLTDKITAFVSPNLYLPIMFDSTDWYTSEHQLLLVESIVKGEKKHSIENGFLAKWKDDDDFFWYNTDQISNVIGWMPLPNLNFSKAAMRKTGHWL